MDRHYAFVAGLILVSIVIEEFCVRAPICPKKMGSSKARGADVARADDAYS